MSSSQIRVAVSAITNDDRHLMLQNVSLLRTSNNKEELQSFIGFIEPLALATAAENESLLRLIIDACGIMNEEQIRVLIPLLKPSQLFQMFSNLEHDSQLSVALSMLDQREELIDLLVKEKDGMMAKREEIQLELERLKKETLPTLEESIRNLEVIGAREGEYTEVVRMARNTKSRIERLQQSARELQATLKLPLKILVEETNRSAFEGLSLELMELTKSLHQQFAILTADHGLLSLLNRQWERIKLNLGAAQEPQIGNEDSMFVDDELAIELYEAVKKIGNPEAIASEHYPMTWNDIIRAGFRGSKDFGEKGIATLEQLQSYITRVNNNICASE